MVKIKVSNTVEIGNMRTYVEREIKKSGSVLLSHDLSNHSIIGLEGLNFRVRNGNGWIPFGIATGN